MVYNDTVSKDQKLTDRILKIECTSGKDRIAYTFVTDRIKLTLSTLITRTVTSIEKAMQ
jgi:hypothetical protein